MNSRLEAAPFDLIFFFGTTETCMRVYTKGNRSCLKKQETLYMLAGLSAK